MVDWNMIRYITDKISQGESPEDIKKKLIENGYDTKLINESFTQAIPWLKPAEQEKIKALQAQHAPTPSTIASSPVSQEQVSKPAEAVRIPIKTEESKPDIKPEIKTGQNLKQEIVPRKNIWLYISIIEAGLILVLLYIILR